MYVKIMILVFQLLINIMIYLVITVGNNLAKLIINLSINTSTYS